jgi:hypothetical protein
VAAIAEQWLTISSNTGLRRRLRRAFRRSPEQLSSEDIRYQLHLIHQTVS